MTAGSESAMTMVVGGTTKSVAHLMEFWKTVCRAWLSFLWSSLENAGRSMVVIGVAKNVMRTENVVAMPKLPMVAFSAT